MSKLQITMNALQTALADAPNTPTAWVPLRRATVEEALRVLGGIPVALLALGALDNEYGTVPAAPTLTWRYPVLSAEEAAGQGERVFVADEVRTLHVNGSVSAKTTGNGNGAVTVAPAELVTYTQPTRTTGKAAPAPVKATNTWRRIPKPERLTLVCTEIARIADGRTWVTQAEFDRSKPDAMPSASGLTATLDLTWIELVCKALPAAVVPAAQPGKRKAKEPAAPAAEPFRAAA